MALNTNKDLKQYYSIHEVAEKFGVSESLLRYWEQEFPQLSPHKAGRNIRQYTKDDIETVRIIYSLLKQRGMKIANAREMLKKNKTGEQNMGDVINRLKEVRKKLVEMRSSLNLIDPDLLPEKV